MQDRIAAGLLLLASCATDVQAPDELSALVGPEGGVLEGLPETAFEGVRLEIPAGALAAPTDVRIRVVSDDTPLPERAERVGTQFAFEPAIELAAPARLSLPVFSDQVQRLGQGAGDVKVWVRDSDAWALHEAAATAEDSVTIELASLTTAAAGVLVLGRSISCPPGSTCVTALTSSRTLCDGDFCVETLSPSVRPSIFSPIRGDDAIYFLHLSSDPAGLVAVRFDVATGAVARSELLRGSFSESFSGMVVDTDGTVIVGTRQGTAFLRFGRPSGLADALLGRGAVRTDTLVQARDRGWARVSGGVVGPTTAWPAEIGTLPLGAPLARDASRPSAFWTTSSTGALLVRIDTTPGITNIDLAPLASGTSVLRFGEIATAPGSGELAVLALPGPQILVRRRGELRLSPISIAAAFGFDYDRDDALWVSSRDTAEVLRVPAGTGAPTRIALTTAAAGTTEYSQRLPRAIHALRDGSVAVITRGGLLLRVRPRGL
jgi:hypothetical protein